jgi:hypothetical protein
VHMWHICDLDICGAYSVCAYVVVFGFNWSETVVNSDGPRFNE